MCLVPPGLKLLFPPTFDVNVRVCPQVEIDKLDYHHFLPLFFDGLSETAHPYAVLARQGVHDMLEHGGPRILPVIPQLIMPIKSECPPLRLSPAPVPGVPASADVISPSPSFSARERIIQLSPGCFIQFADLKCVYCNS